MSFQYFDDVAKENNKCGKLVYLHFKVTALVNRILTTRIYHILLRLSRLDPNIYTYIHLKKSVQFRGNRKTLRLRVETTIRKTIPQEL